MYISAVLALAATTVFAAPSPLTHKLHEKREYLSSRWIRGNEVPHHALHPVRIGMQQSNLHRADELLMEVSDMDSPKYGQHYTAEEVADIFAPSQETVDALKTWLHESGITGSRVSQSLNKQWLQFDANTAELSALLKTKYHEYYHPETGTTHVACDEYHLPHHVAEHVDYITPGVKLMAARRAKPNSLDKRRLPKLPPMLKPLPMPLAAIIAARPIDAQCQAAITPACIKSMYNITNPTTKYPGNELGIFEDLGDHYAQADLDLFYTSFAMNIPAGTAPEARYIDGATGPAATPATAGPESDLDFQISYPIIYPQQTALFQTDDDVYESNYTYAGFLNNFLDAIDGSYCTYSAFGETGNSPLDPPYPDPQAGGYKGQLQCGVYKPTNVISISYGGQEADLPVNYQKRQCNEFLKLGMQGVSILVSSGDSGVAGPSGDDSSNGCLNNGTVFSPDFPASCPYITTVGATFIPVGALASQDQETAVTRFPSGGGFSNIYPIPSYQQKAVNTYLTQHTPPYKSYSTTNSANIGAGGGIYNRAGRGYPDVSAIGDNVIIYNMGAPTLIGGTSASSPCFAAILTRINEVRLIAGKSTIGFVNPTLYANPGYLHDITVGSNPGCGTNGFSVASGWDPVTGLGTPRFMALMKLFNGARH